ncbi:hypothetical protein BDZ89DRAFT_748198 [Hymenopellis radicata]|nr:hypothetical protein BDZ89DRAFT_748198 [Hymenopellis radicata]
MCLEPESEFSASNEASSTVFSQEFAPPVPAEIAAVVKDKMRKQKKRMQQTQTSVSTKTRFIGFVYLDRARESEGVLDVGMIIDPAHRGWGYARDALDQVLTIAFETFKCHRVQAHIVEGPYKANTLKAVTHLKFTHEGTSRKSFFSPHLQEWKDVTCLAMLDTDWVVRDSIRVAPLTLWDEMFVRHDSEREDLLKWQEWEKMNATFGNLGTSQAVPVK